MRPAPATLAALVALALPAAADPVTVTATLAIGERIALPPGALVVAELHDGAGRLIGSSASPTGGAQVPLRVTVDAPEAAEVMVLRAGITGFGAPWLSDAVIVPRDAGAPDAGEIVARRVAPSGPATAWRCGETLFWLAWGQDGARLRKGGQSVALAAEPAASGAKAVDPADAGTFAWSKGPDLTVSWRGEDPGRCLPALDPLAAGLSARGNEPGWRLEMSGGRIDVARLDTAGLTLPLPVPEITASGLRYAAGGVTVTVEDRIARDTMTGMPYPLAVTVETAEGTLTGTGGDPAALIEGLDWRVDTVAGTALPEGVSASLRFEGQRIGGRGGCNRFAGAFALSGETLTIGPVAATMMACPGPAMAAERALFAAFEATRGFDIDDTGALLLLGATGPLARLLP